jgi:hypothetical protein
MFISFFIFLTQLQRGFSSWNLSMQIQWGSNPANQNDLNILLHNNKSEVPSYFWPSDNLYLSKISLVFYTFFSCGFFKKNSCRLGYFSSYDLMCCCAPTSGLFAEGCHLCTYFIFSWSKSGNVCT